MTDLSAKNLICIVGPTGIGKTALTIELAKKYRTDVISADSRQFYREMNIGTAKPNEDELQSVTHYFINSHSIHDNYSAGDYERDALERSEEHTSELQSLMRISYAVFCLKKKNKKYN